MGGFFSRPKRPRGPSPAEIAGREEAARQRERDRIAKEEAARKAEEQQKAEAKIAEREGRRRRFAGQLASAEGEAGDERKRFLQSA